MTIKDIARACGVSVSTVSRVLNGRPDVSADVRKRILDEMNACSYIPNSSARDLVRVSSDAIGVVVRGAGSLFFADLLKTAAEEIRRAGFSMIVRQIGFDQDEVTEGAALVREKKVQGLLFLGGRFDYTPAEVASISVPYVCCSYTNSFGTLSPESYSSVSIDDEAAARQAVQTLMDLGHRRIAAIIPSRSDHSVSQLRWRGFENILTSAGLPCDLIAETGGSFSMGSAYHAVCELLDRDTYFTAIFALSDTMAMAAIKALTDRGLRVPGDCSVIAIDGLPISTYTVPTLTTMVQPTADMGRESVRILSDMLEGKPAVHLCLDTRLRPGGSVAAPRV